MQNHVSQPMTPNVSPQTVQRMPLTIWGATDVGREREGNEDSIYPQSDGGGYTYEPKPATLDTLGQLLIVADGVGGAQAGRASSQWAIQRAVENYYEQQSGSPGAVLQNAVVHANASLFRYLQETGVREAGCTMAAAVIHNNMLHVANVGDSRVYLIRDGQIYQQTRDHTLTQQKVDQNIITPEQALDDPDKSVLTRSMGNGPQVVVDLFQPVPLQQGDLVLICSDGLYDLVPDAEIARLATSGSPQKAVQKLIAAANRAGGFDNISVILAQVGGRPTGGGAASLLGNFSMSQQKILLGLLAALVVVVLALGGWIGWTLYDRGKDGDKRATAAPATTAATVDAATTASVPQIQATPTKTPESASPSGGEQATSTPKPSSTPTPTLTPVPPTLTPVPVLPTSPSTDSGGGGGGGGGQTENCGSKPLEPCRNRNQSWDCVDGDWVCK